MKKVLLTGAGGFVGRHFLAINAQRYEIVPVSLRNTEWQQQSFSGFHAVVHLAGKAHEMTKINDQVYFDINTTLTRQLFQKAEAEGVPHFIYISSTKVYGDEVTGVLNEESPCHPTDAYGKSKLEAEQFLLQHNNKCRVAVVRPPLVYGAGVKGNMVNLLRLCEKKWPLPFKGTSNRRSMVFTGNLVALINTIIEQEASGVFVAGDAQPLSTGELVTYIRRAMNRNPGMFRLPGILKSFIRAVKPALYIRLFGSFEVNPEAGFAKLKFTPPYSTEQGIAEMVKGYLTEKQ